MGRPDDHLISSFCGYYTVTYEEDVHASYGPLGDHVFLLPIGVDIGSTILPAVDRVHKRADSAILRSALIASYSWSGCGGEIARCRPHIHPALGQGLRVPGMQSILWDPDTTLQRINAECGIIEVSPV